MTSNSGSRDEKRQIGLDLCCQRKYEEMEPQAKKRNSKPKGPQEAPSPRMSTGHSGAFKQYHNVNHNVNVGQRAGLARSSC